MHKFFEDYLNQLSDLNKEAEKQIDSLSPEALDWTPGPDMNSLAVLIAHLTGSQRYWIGDMGIGDPSGRVRQAEFDTRGVTAEDLKARLHHATDYARTALGSLAYTDLETMRPTPDGKKEYSVGWSLLHSLEHTSQHVGHLQMTRQLWEQRKS